MDQTFETTPMPNSATGSDSSDDSSFEFRPETVPALLKIQLLRYRDELDPYRLPLEDLQLPEQQMLVLDWINDILNRPNLRIGKKFLSKLEKTLKELDVDWDSEISITSLIHMIFPKESEAIDYVSESYALLIYMLMLRTKYQQLPTAQYKIKKCAFYGTKAYLSILDERIRLKKLTKGSFWASAKRWFYLSTCVIVGRIFAEVVIRILSGPQFHFILPNPGDKK